MDKALIEKAFEKWLEDYKSRSRCTHLDAFAGGATWQLEIQATSLRELESKVKELEAEIEKWTEDNVRQQKFIDENTIKGRCGNCKNWRSIYNLDCPMLDGCENGENCYCSEFIAKLDLLSECK